jgi:hypothetical protein
MESDEDTFQMGDISRSWDDIEGARRSLSTAAWPGLTTPHL